MFQRITSLLHDNSGHLHTSGTPFADGKQIIHRIGPLVKEIGHSQDAGMVLDAASTALLKAERVAVLTGFPCNLDQPCMHENDGPAGAVAVARALQHLGKEARILTEVLP